MRLLLSVFFAGLLLMGVGLAGAAERPGAEVGQRLGLPADLPLQWHELATSPDKGFDEAEAQQHGPDILRFEVAHLGGQRLLFKTTFAHRPDFASSIFIIYLDMDDDAETGRVDPHHGGVDVMITAASNHIVAGLHNVAYNTQNTLALGAVEGTALWVMLDSPLTVQDGEIKLGTHLLSQQAGGQSDSTPHSSARLAFSSAEPPALPASRDGSLRPLSEYRYYDDQVKLERLSDKGLRGNQVKSATPYEPGRERPLVTFMTEFPPAPPLAAAPPRQVAVEVLEESGQTRTASPLRFGFPLPAGGFYNTDHVRLLGTDLKEIPTQITGLSRWPDNSLKWVLIESLIPLEAGGRKYLPVEFGPEVRHQTPASTLQIDETPQAFTITTGPLQVVVNRQRFNLLQSVARDANGDGRFSADEQLGGCGATGIQLRDETGQLFTMAGQSPDSLRWEQRGPLVAVLRAEGAYCSAAGEQFMKYVARLTFRAGSARVDLAMTLVNDHLAHEFSDLTSLELPLLTAGDNLQTDIYLTDEQGALQAHRGGQLALFQADERTCHLQAGGQRIDSDKAPGALQWQTSRGAVTAVLHEFWQRWPKGLRVADSELTVDLLPRQPGPQYGEGLPHYLLFPFVEGKYRLKWGMSFTERLTLDYSGAAAAAVLAEVERPLLPVVPAGWLAETRALGPLAEPQAQQFALRDRVVAGSYQAHLASRDRTREYGFLNYGDWFGERARNWGNNEYDFGHSFFMEYARTGNRDYYRLALTHARHQADVDLVHAYPDPYYIGGNHPHSIGHTGSWTETTAHGTWSHRYDSMTSAANGHTWADGMVDAWCLGGEARVMEGALALGEHIAWGMSQTFRQLGTHERTAGWSLRAVMALYRATSDPVYLEAAHRIVAVPLREQNFADGGAWPHVLPGDHAGGHPNAVGNNTFLIGVLLGGLKAYHEVTDDPATEKALRSGVDWLAKAWDESVRGWPYSASPQGEPYHKASTSLNMLIIEPVAYVAKLTQDHRLWQIASESFEAATGDGSASFGKSNAQKMFFSSGLMALLQDHLRSQSGLGDNYLSGDDEWMANYLSRTPYAGNHGVRAPDQKVFFVQLKGEQSQLTAQRQPHGALNKRADEGTLTLTRAGEMVVTDSFSTDLPHEFSTTLSGPPGRVYRVVIDDDQRAIWNLQGDNLSIVMQAGEGFRLGGVGRARYAFYVPEGADEFTFKLTGVHTGRYGAVVLDPDGKVAGTHQSSNDGGALLPTTPPADAAGGAGNSPRGEVTVKPAPEQTGKLWSVILFAALDLGVELEGIPPYLSLMPDDWFEVKEQ